MSFNPEGHFPTGHFPEGHFPEATAESDYPTVADARRITLPSGGVWVVDPDDEEWCEVDWSGVLPDGVTLASVAWTLPGNLSNVDEAIDTALGKSALKVDGAQHAGMYAVQVVATLSNSNTIPFTAPMRCFNG